MKGKRLCLFSKKSLIIFYAINYLVMIAAAICIFINWHNTISIWLLVSLTYGLILAKFIRYEIEYKIEQEKDEDKKD
ncbi:hypothetical protein [Caloranaerobacter ferrireducens]|uniref:hypothetical protein n=1 Tax=Caloranaerobacter ferrireducens TaxID=1323370 RepID=UPI00084CFF03|nr:hypothetical protein [Caloranaerobacter ferrireducens]